MAVAMQAFAVQEVSKSQEWEKRLDRVDVYLSTEGYWAKVVRRDEHKGDSAPEIINNRHGVTKHWRDLDNLVAYVLRNISDVPSFHVHMERE